MSAPEIFLTWVAAQTSRIRIGHGVVCMPFNYNHPVRVAERAAMLDILSDGRLDLGAGRGATLQEMSLCGVDPDRTYAEVEEALRMIGAHVARRRRRRLRVARRAARSVARPHPILPRPVQMPHPPLFLACTKHDTVALAAEYGIGALVLGFAGPDEVAELREIYDETIAARTRRALRVVRGQRPLLRAVPDDRARRRRRGARRSARAGQRFFAEAITHWYGGGPPPSRGHRATSDNVAEIAEAASERWSPGCTRPRSRCTPTTTERSTSTTPTATPTTRSTTSSASRTPAPTRSCA